MTIPVAVKSVAYTGNGVTTSFPVPFPFYELTVYNNGAVVFIGTYGIGAAATGGNGLPGSVEFSTPPASGHTVTIVSSTMIYQGLDLVENDAFPAESLERALDRLVCGLQDVSNTVDHTLRLSPVGPPPGALTNTPGVLRSDGSTIAFATDVDASIAALHATDTAIYSEFRAADITLQSNYRAADTGLQTEFRAADAALQLEINGIQTVAPWGLRLIPTGSPPSPTVFAAGYLKSQGGQLSFVNEAPNNTVQIVRAPIAGTDVATALAGPPLVPAAGIGATQDYVNTAVGAVSSRVSILETAKTTDEATLAAHTASLTSLASRATVLEAASPLYTRQGII